MMDTAASTSLENGTPTPTRKAQVANLRERRQSRPNADANRADAELPADAVSISSNGTVVRVSKTEAKAEAAAAAAAAVAVNSEAQAEVMAEADYISDHRTFDEDITRTDLQERSSSHSARRVLGNIDKDVNELSTIHTALESTVPLPRYDILATAGQELAVEGADRHSILRREFLTAAEAYEAISTRRDLHGEDADLARVSKLSLKLYEANTRLLHAEREYYKSKAEINELRELPLNSHAEPDVSDPQNPLTDAIQIEKAKDAEISEGHELHVEEIRDLKAQAERDSETIASLRDQLQRTKLDSVRSALASSRQVTELTGYNSFLSWEAAELASRLKEMESVIANLQWQKDLFENACKPSLSTDASAARAISMSLAYQLGGPKELDAAELDPVRDTRGEIQRLCGYLEKFGVLRFIKDPHDVRAGESNSEAFL